MLVRTALRCFMLATAVVTNKTREPGSVGLGLDRFI